MLCVLITYCEYGIIQDIYQFYEEIPAVADSFVMCVSLSLYISLC